MLRAMKRWLYLIFTMACGARQPGATGGPAERYRGPVIDIHAHLFTAEELASSAPAGTPAGVEGLRALDDQAGVTRSALIVMARRGDLAATRAQNDHVIAEAAHSGGRFFAVASVHPLDGAGALDELTRLAAAGVRIIKLHPNTQQFDVGAPEVEAVAARAGELGLVLLFDGYSPFDANETGKFLLLAVKQPRARIIIAHIGGPRFHEMALFAMVKVFPYYHNNVWFDLSATSHLFAGSPYEAELRWLARQLGTDRILFGSDFPVDRPAHAVDDVARLGFTAAEQRQIFHDNAEALLR